MCFSHLLADAAAEKTAMMVERLLADLPTPPPATEPGATR